VRSLSAGLLAQYQSRDGTRATCLKVVLVNGTVLGFTAFNRDLVVSGVTYYAATGYAMRDLSTPSALNVTNTEVDGPLIYPNVTESDLLSGLWDFAYFELFEVNWADLTQGRMILHAGHFGQITTERGSFKSELRGLADAYTRTIGRIDSPACDAQLGDSRCKVIMGPFTKTGTVTSVGTDNVTFGDTSRTEPGPVGAVSIVSITNANPGVVTLADNSLNLTEGMTVVLSGIIGPVALDGQTIVRSPTSLGTAESFNLGVDTSNTTDYPPYTGGGICTPLGGTSGYFDFGLVTWTSGNNNGLSMEVRSYIPGTFTLQLPMPSLIQVGDTYSAKAGCDKLFPTCRDRFNNAVNFRGDPYFPGNDKILQVGRHQ
jgi:uncharacterized phage protein (TIGR02218 family)